MRKLIVFLMLFVFGCARPYSGSIKKDTVWKDRIKLTGDVVVERGASLKILPGTKITSKKNLKTQVRYLREESGKTFNILHNEKAEILVEGTFEAQGESEKPILFEDVGGIIFLGKSTPKASYLHFKNVPLPLRFYGETTPDIKNILIENAEVAGMGFWDMSGGTVDSCVISNARHGIGLSDFSAPVIKNSTITFCKMAGVFCEGAATGAIRNNRFAGNNAAIAAGDITAPEITQNSITGCGAGISLGIKAKAKIFTNSIMKNLTGILLQGESSAEASENFFEKNGSAIASVEKSKTNISGNIFRENTISVIVRDTASADIRKNVFQLTEGIKLQEIAMAKIISNSFEKCSPAIRLMNRSRYEMSGNKLVSSEISDERTK